MLKIASASIALLALSNPALAAACATPSEASALKTAVMQQELMVAALQCREAAAYNRFVSTYRPELQSSDASLKAFFVRRGGEHGEAGYDAFKTKAANLSALENARNAGAFCADARSLFQAAMSHRGSLMSFIDQRSLASDMGNVCLESKPQAMLARLEDRPQAPVKAIAVAAAPVRIAQAAPRAEVAVAGVPSHSLPAIPYQRDQDEELTPPPAPRELAVQRRELARAEPRPQARSEARTQFQPESAVDDEQDDIAPAYAADEDAAPPPRPRYYRVRERRYDDDYAYAPRQSYGPPPGWQQRDYPAPAPYRWYPRGYSNW
jgi:hypothetical protein